MQDGGRRAATAARRLLYDDEFVHRSGTLFAEIEARFAA
jgi:hypothetical protein